ncbi:MAG: prolyl oligopeptidase family serine peptidase [Pseudogulbenkiania sp.]|nr:prolyl oligopeptidase family serine peptidase [Pseudogulbenkiania sp.]
MNSASPLPDKVLLPGSTGLIEVLCDKPEGGPKGVAVITHPHPLLGGTAQHKIPHQLARLLQAMGYVALRPNFRGVGKTAGTHDLGVGEVDDTLAVVHAFAEAIAPARLILVGFSFGAYVQAKVAEKLDKTKHPLSALVLIGTPFGVIGGERAYDTPAVPRDTIVIHGEKDEVVPLARVMDWARPQALPVVVIPGANHFFSGKLIELQATVKSHLEAALMPPVSAR